MVRSGGPSQIKKLVNILKISKINTIMAKKVNYELYDDRVLVKPAAAEEKTAGGIIIPDTAKEKPQRGTIVAVGPGKYAEQTGNLIPVKQKIGDTVLYGKYAGTEISVDGEDYLIMKASDILMKVQS
jgi:chaperonin GroES